MKLLVLWLVASWVVAVTASRPCAEYCVYLSSGYRDIEFQTECDCMYEEPVLADGQAARILYEQARLRPDYIHHKPFYILNPITPRRAYSTDSNQIIPETIQPSPNAYTYYRGIEHDANIYSTHNRKEKHIRSINKNLNTPIYLDIDVDLTAIERSASSNTLTAEDLNVTEQNLLECANLYTALYSKKNTDTKVHDITGSNLSNDDSETSNENLKEQIRNKCSHISLIVTESLNEIKKTRSKVTSITYRTNNNDQQNNEMSHSNGIKIENKETLCSNNNENDSSPPIQHEFSERTMKEYTEINEQTTISHTDSSENTPMNTLSPEMFSTVSNLTPVAEVQYFSEFPTTTEIPTTEKYIESRTTMPKYKENEYPFREESGTTIASTSKPSVATTLTSKYKKDLHTVEDKQTEKESKSAKIERQSENRERYEEGEVPLIKIITHEFANDTVQSFINGTEDIPNGDFNDELKPADVNKGTENSTIILTSNQVARLAAVRDETRSANKEDQKSTDTDLSGNLYFLFNNEQIPAKFVQNANGSLHIGIDGVSLCNKLTENTENQSLFLTNLCNCYASDNCTYT